MTGIVIGIGITLGWLGYNGLRRIVYIGKNAREVKGLSGAQNIVRLYGTPDRAATIRQFHASKINVEFVDDMHN
jgi:hypothetical protein